MIFSEVRLGLTPKWFTGKEWADGTAERELRQEYKLACKREQAKEDAKTPQEKAADRRAMKEKRFQNWFTYSLKAEPRKFADNQGLSPMQIVRSAMKK